MYQQTILLVEDSDDIRLLMRMILEMKGYRVVEATNGKEAIEQALREPPELILMDLSMPVMDGWEATHQLRQYETLREVPIVGVSAHSYGERLELAIKAGCNDCVRKPMDEHVLNRILAEFLTLN